MHLKVSGRALETDGQMKWDMYLHLPPKLFLHMDGNSSAIGKSLSVVAVVIAIMLGWEESGEEETQRDGNINSSTYNRLDDEEFGFAV
jgi:hypothetical protein